MVNVCGVDVGIYVLRLTCYCELVDIYICTDLRSFPAMEVRWAHDSSYKNVASSIERDI